MIFIFSLSLPLFAQLSTNETPYLLSQAKDMSADFADFAICFLCRQAIGFDTEKLREPLRERHSLYIPWQETFNVNTVFAANF